MNIKIKIASEWMKLVPVSIKPMNEDLCGRSGGKIEC